MISGLERLLSYDIVFRLQTEAERRNVPMDVLIHEAIMSYVDRLDDGVPQRPSAAVSDAQRLATSCRDLLNLSEELGDEYSYPHLPLCVIDAVFSIGVRYTSTRKVVDRFCEHVRINSRTVALSANAREFTVSDLIELYNRHSLDFITSSVYQNSQRTSTSNGILKSEAVLRIARLLSVYGVNTMADTHKFIDNPEFEVEFRRIPGQTSGISLRYLRMLTGLENEVKPDRMIVRFITQAIGRQPAVEECLPLMIKTCHLLADEYPHLTPRTLDNLMWRFQSAQS